MTTSRDKVAQECRKFADDLSENTMLDSVQTARALRLLTAAANRIDVLCCTRGRLLDKVLPRQRRNRKKDAVNT
jgi:hypothetical protein